MNTVNHFIENHGFWSAVILGVAGSIVLIFLACCYKEDELRSGDDVIYDPGDGSRPIQAVVVTVFPAFGNAVIKVFGTTMVVSQTRLKRIPTKLAP